jgi:hypothetical protein
LAGVCGERWLLAADVLERRAACHGLSPKSVLAGRPVAVLQLCLFPAVNRECRVRGVRGVPAAELLALAFALLARFGDQGTELVERVLLSPVWGLT